MNACLSLALFYDILKKKTAANESESLQVCNGCESFVILLISKFWWHSMVIQTCFTIHRIVEQKWKIHSADN